MNEPLTREAVRAYVERWKLVNDRELEELRKLSAQQKLEQLVGLFEFGRALGLQPDPPESDQVIRSRWNRLRRNVADKR